MIRNISKIEGVINLLILATTLVLLLVFKPPQGANINFYTILSVNLFLGFVVFYNHLFWLIPNYIAQKKYWAYVKYSALMLPCIGFIGLALFAGLDALIGVMPVETSWNAQLLIATFFVGIAFNLLLVLPFTFIYLFIRDWFKTKKLNKHAEIGLHLFFGGVLWIYLFQRLSPWDIHQYPKPFYASLAYASLLWIGAMTLFYVNALWCIPKFLAHKKFKKYFLSLFVLFVACILVDGLLASQVRFFQVVIGKRIIEPFVMASLWIKLLLILPLSFFYRFTKDWITSLMVKQQLAIAELDYLKTQIKPHFLFNTLNSLYAGAIEDNSPATAEGITKLSNLMRYTLHESEQDRVALRTEIDYIDDYIALQLMRLPEHIQSQIQFNCTGYIEEASIAPMMLITFIENCFQHGIYAGQATNISITIKIEENILFLTTKNPIFQTPTLGNGVGLANTIKRLAILYPNQHDLNQTEEAGHFISKLSIQLH